MRNGMRPIHPGVSAAGLARALGVPTNRITGVLNEERALTADTALRLARYTVSLSDMDINQTSINSFGIIVARSRRTENGCSR
jgi:plasmid maintenance system antidote protein VapI